MWLSYGLKTVSNRSFLFVGIAKTGLCTSFPINGTSKLDLSKEADTNLSIIVYTITGDTLLPIGIPNICL